MTYPSTIDSFNDPQATDKLNNPSHSAIERAQNLALSALETLVGTTAPSYTAGMYYKLVNASSVDPGHKHTYGSWMGTFPTSSLVGTFPASSLAGVVPSANLPIGFGAGQLITWATSATYPSGDGANITNIAAMASQAAFTAGATVSAGQPLHITPYYQAGGGVVLDTQSASGYAGTTNQSKSFVVGSGSNRALLVSVISNSAPSGVTYAGVAMTLVDSQALASSFVLYVYKLVAPTSGTNNIIVTGTGISSIAAAAYTGVNQSTFVEASAKNATTASITTLSQGALLHAFSGESHTVGGSFSSNPSISTKYLNTLALTNVSDFTGTNCLIGSATGVIYNEVFGTSIGVFVGGGGGTVGSGVIVVSLAPANPMSVAVVPASSAAIISNPPLIDFVGFAKTGATAGQSVSATTSGLVTGLSGLTPGTAYYLQSTAGTIGTARGIYGKLIGYALSATTLLVSPNKTMGSQILKVTAYTYTAECDGFLSTNAVSAAGTILTDGITTSFTGTGTNGSNIMVPVSRGKTYVITSGASGTLYFTPLA